MLPDGISSVFSLKEINTTFFLREALAASANGTTSTTRSAAAAPMRVTGEKVAGSWWKLVEQHTQTPYFGVID